MVMGVRPGAPAADAGLRGAQRAADGSIVSGDVIQKVAGRPVRTAADLHAELERHPVGEPVTLTIWRDGRTMDVQVTPQATADQF